MHFWTYHSIFIITFLAFCLSDVHSEDGEKCDLKLWYMDLLIDGVFDKDLTEKQVKVQTNIAKLIQKNKGKGAVMLDCDLLSSYEDLLRKDFLDKNALGPSPSGDKASSADGNQGLHIDKTNAELPKASPDSTPEKQDITEGEKTNNSSSNSTWKRRQPSKFQKLFCALFLQQSFPDKSISHLYTAPFITPSSAAEFNNQTQHHQFDWTNLCNSTTLSSFICHYYYIVNFKCSHIRGEGTWEVIQNEEERKDDSSVNDSQEETHSGTYDTPELASQVREPPADNDDGSQAAIKQENTNDDMDEFESESDDCDPTDGCGGDDDEDDDEDIDYGVEDDNDEQNSDVPEEVMNDDTDNNDSQTSEKKKDPEEKQDSTASERVDKEAHIEVPSSVPERQGLETTKKQEKTNDGERVAVDLNKLTSVRDSTAESHETRQVLPDIEDITNRILKVTGQEYADKIKGLEIQILKMENLLLRENLESNNNASTMSKLENHILKLENELLKINNSFTTLRVENDHLKKTQIVQENNLAIVKKQSEEVSKYPQLADNSSMISDAIVSHQKKITELAMVVQKQSSYLQHLEEKSALIEKQNEILSERLSKQTSLVDKMLLEMANITSQQMVQQDLLQRTLHQINENQNRGVNPQVIDAKTDQADDKPEDKQIPVEQLGPKPKEEGKIVQVADLNLDDLEMFKAELDNILDDAKPVQKENSNQAIEQKVNSKAEDVVQDEVESVKKAPEGNTIDNIVPEKNPPSAGPNDAKPDDQLKGTERKNVNEEGVKEKKESKPPVQKEGAEDIKQDSSKSEPKATEKKSPPPVDEKRENNTGTNIKVPKQADIKEDKSSKNESNDVKKQENGDQVKAKSGKVKKELPRITPANLRPEDKSSLKDCFSHYLRGRRRNTPVKVKPYNADKEVEVYCDMKGGGWTIIQRRQDGSLDFYREWEDYKNGFGNVYGEYWIGNDYFHYFTNQDHYTLRIELTDWEDNLYYAEYDYFIVENEDHHYRLHIGDYKGNAGDAMKKHHGHKFSTYDVDNDKAVKDFGGSCAKRFSGGWWYYKCYQSNLNGRYYPDGVVAEKRYDGIAWKELKSAEYSFKKIEMKIRPISALKWVK